MAISIADKGVGTDGSQRPGSFGSQLVQRLVTQVPGELEFAPNKPETLRAEPG